MREWKRAYRLSFEQMAAERPMIFDTCSLAHIHSSGSRKEGYDPVAEEKLSANHFMRKAKGPAGRIFVTSGVARQYVAQGKINMMVRRSLIERITKKGGLLDLKELNWDEFLMYNRLFEAYRTKWPELKVDGVDFEEALIALTISQYRRPHYFVTSDHDLASITSHMAKAQRLSKSQLCVLTRWEFDEYGDPFKG